MRNPYSASQLGRRFLCSGSAKAEAGLPEIETDEAASGTRIHRAAAVLDVREPGFEHVNEAASAFDLNEDEADVLRSWIRFRDHVLPADKFETEVPMQLWDCFDRPDAVEAVEVTDGTADVVGHSISGRTVYVPDLKTGYQPQERTSLAFQMSVYMAMAIQKYDADEAIAIVYQPRIHKTYEYHLKAGEVQDTVRLVQRVISNCERAGLEIHPSVEACRFCRARHSCPGPRSLAHPLVETKDLASVPAERLAELWEFWKVVKKQGEALDTVFRGRVRKGDVPGYYIQERNGNRRFTSMRTAFQSVADVIGADDFIELCTISPAKLEAEYVKRAQGFETKKAAKEEFTKRAGDAIERGRPKEFITKESE